MTVIWTIIIPLWWNFHHLLIQNYKCMSIKPIPLRWFILHGIWYLVIILSYMSQSVLNNICWRICNGNSESVQTFITSNYIVVLDALIMNWRKPYNMNIPMLCTVLQPLSWCQIAIIYHTHHLCLPVDWLILSQHFQQLWCPIMLATTW